MDPEVGSLKTRLFHTALLASDYYRFSPPPYKGRRWHVRLVAPRMEFPLGGEFSGDNLYEAKQLVICARDEIAAQRAANLIHASRLVLETSAFLSHLGTGEYQPIYAAQNNGRDLCQNEMEFIKNNQVRTPNLPLACQIAARTSSRRQYVYALAKLRLSLEIFSLHFVDLDPHHSLNVPKSPLPEDHVRLAFAIIAAWSCIEELGFEIRANGKNPSKLKDGSWNPNVKNELENRLRLGHINLKELFPWSLRGPRTRIERKRPPQILKKASWARYDVRDGEMQLIDALHYVSYLRSWIATHRSDKRLLRVLSVYDVSNAQLLARRLFLEKLGFWRYWGKVA